MFKELKENPYAWGTENKEDISKTKLGRYTGAWFLSVCERNKKTLEELNLGVDVYMTQSYLCYENIYSGCCVKWGEGGQSRNTETRWTIVIVWVRNDGPID